MTNTSGNGSRRIALVVISDRGDLYLPKCLATLDAFGFDFAQRIVMEDPTHRWDQNEVVVEAWSRVGSDIDYVFHLEEDFLFQELDIAGMVRVLEANPDLAQVVLKRQPWNHLEHAAGGIMEQWPDEYEDCDGFLRHRRIFSLNPCLIPRHVVAKGWAGSEGDMTGRCLEEGLAFAFYGARQDPPRCIHVGEVRG